MCRGRASGASSLRSDISAALVGPECDSARRVESFLLKFGIKLGSRADTWRSRLTLKVALIKGVWLRTNVGKLYRDQPHRLDESEHKQKKEISVDEKSVVESYKLKEASIRLTLQCFLPRLECSQGDLSAFHSFLNPSELMGKIFPFPRRGWIC